MRAARGDEFAVLLSDSDDPVVVAERIIAALRRPFQIGEHELFLSVRIGIASGDEDAETVLRHADVAMYHAKQAGADRYACFTPSMHTARMSRLSLDTELRRAVDRDELELHYQPLFNLRSGAIEAFEALLRWRHPDRGLVTPLEFIPRAEETGLIVEIGRWVLAQACAQFATWWRGLPLALAVNVSARELQDAGYAAAAEQAIAGAFPSSQLVLEITETAPLLDTPRAVETLRSIKDIGARLALDDFGTGYSSLLNLARLPVDAVKIARPFISAAGHHSPRACELIAAILDVAGHLGLKTVAEGIERHEELAVLLESTPRYRESAGSPECGQHVERHRRAVSGTRPPPRHHEAGLACRTDNPNEVRVARGAPIGPTCPSQRRGFRGDCGWSAVRAE